MTLRLRGVLVGGLTLVFLWTWFDPYSRALNGSDGIMSAPRWQTFTDLIDLFLLCAAGLLALVGRLRLTVTILAIEFLWAAAWNGILIWRDGSERFIWGFGATRHYLDCAVVFGLRVLMLVAASNALRREHSGASDLMSARS